MEAVHCITLPHLIPVIVLLQILAVGRIFGSDFDMFYTLPNGAALVKDVTYTLDVFVYSMLRSGTPLGYPAAAAFLQSVVRLHSDSGHQLHCAKNKTGIGIVLEQSHRKGNVNMVTSVKVQAEAGG